MWAVEVGWVSPFEAIAAVVMVEVGIHWLVQIYAVLENVLVGLAVLALLRHHCMVDPTAVAASVSPTVHVCGNSIYKGTCICTRV